MKNQLSSKNSRAASAATVEHVVGAGLCTGCGLCASIAGPAISMGINVEGNMRPLVRKKVEDEKNAQIMATCPGVSVEGPGRPEGVVVHPCGDRCVRSIDPGRAIRPSVIQYRQSRESLTNYWLRRSRAMVHHHLSSARQGHTVRRDREAL